jgi:hypothetical protein
MLCKDGERRYEWTEIALTVEDARFCDPIDNPSHDEICRQKIALSKLEFNERIFEIRGIFELMMEQNYPLPHKVNVRLKKLSDLSEGFASEIRESDARSGLATIWLEDWPLFGKYFHACIEKDLVLTKVNAYERKLIKIIRGDYDKKKPKVRDQA